MKSASRSRVLTLTGTGPLAALAALLLIAFSFSIIAYPTQTEAQVLSADATLSALTISPKNIIGFDAGRFDYHLGVAGTVERVTITATPNHNGATVAYNITDADTDTPGHQVDPHAGYNTVRITVTAQDTVTIERYFITIGRSVTTDYGWNAERDLNGLVAAGADGPWGVWGDSSTIWVVDHLDTYVYAYNRDGSRDTTKGFNLHANHDNPLGAWSNGTTVWIVDRNDNRLYAYEVSSGTRQSSKEITLHADNAFATGVWSDGTTVWVGDFSDRKLYAYALDGGAPQPTRDITTASSHSLSGIWSDGVTMWVVLDIKGVPSIGAYSLDDGSPTSAHDFNTLSVPGPGLGAAAGLWSDGETMWVADLSTVKVFAFNMPVFNKAALRSLYLDGMEVPDFNAATTSYTWTSTDYLERVTVLATRGRPGASTSITPPDADGDAPGHEVNVADAEEVRITITITAQDGTVKKYTVTIHSPICGDSPWGRAVVDRPNCVLLNSLIVSVADGYTVDYASRELAKLPGWTARTRLSFFRMIGAEHSPDNLSLEQLYAERDTIAEFPWARRVGRNTMASVLAGVQGTPSENHAATGQPTTNGTAQVGETLTASTSDIADADGLTNATFSYQWIRNDGSTDTDIQDATASTYTLKGADEGKTIKVRVSFSDDGGNDETLTSAATFGGAAAPNAPATGAPTIGGTAQVGETLTVDTTAIADDDGLDNAAFAYQWVSNDGSADEAIQDATASTYTLKAADEGNTIKVRVSFSDDGGNEETLTSAATSAVAVTAVEAEPTDLPHGLTATASGDVIILTWQDADNDPGRDLYQILRHRPELGEPEPLVYVAHVRSSDSTFTDTEVEPGVLYVYRVKALVDPFGNLSEASDAAEVRMAGTNTPATGAPIISGTAQVGETLTVDTTGIADADGLTDATFSYQWIRNDGSADTDITSATSSTYTLVDADQGKTIKVRVSFTDDAGNDESLTSEAKPDEGTAVSPGVNLCEDIMEQIRNDPEISEEEYEELYQFLCEIQVNPPPADSPVVNLITGDPIAPGSPTGLTTSYNSASGDVDLSWTPSVRGTSDFYRVLRRPKLGVFDYIHRDESLTATAYTDTTALSGRTYGYEVLEIWPESLVQGDVFRQ